MTIEEQTNGRIKETEEGLICTTCGSTNIRESKAGNLYCAEICWQYKEDDKIRGYDDGEPPMNVENSKEE